MQPDPPPHARNLRFDAADPRGGLIGTWLDEQGGVVYWFDAADAGRYVRFIERFLTHDQGALANHPFLLAPWQRDIVLAVFGWKQPDGLRKFRKVFIFVPSGNGKSMFNSAILVAMLIIGCEPRAEIYNAASDREQAKIIFETSKHMVEVNPALRRRVDIFTNSIVLKKDGSFYRVLSGSPGGKHGKRTQALAIDELHELKNRELIDGLGGTLGKRRQPLDLRASTAGFDRTSVCWQEYDYAKKILANPDADPRYLAVIYEAGANDDWKSEDTWRKANPNYGSAVNPEFIRGEFTKALENPAEENAFKRLHLNLWTEQETRWLAVEKWDACLASSRGLAAEMDAPPALFRSLAGCKNYAALDLGSTDDLSAFAQVFPPAGMPPPATKAGEAAAPSPAVSPALLSSVLMRYWMPEDNVMQATRRSGMPYSKWSEKCHCHRGGDPLDCTALIHLTPGTVTDYNFILRDIVAIHGVTPIEELALDPALAAKILNDLSGEGINAFKHQQGFISMGFAVKAMERAILGRLCVHAADAVTRWQFGNIVAVFDPAGNCKFTKKKAKEKIDGMVALAMAFGRAELNLQAGEPSITWI